MKLKMLLVLLLLASTLPIAGAQVLEAEKVTAFEAIIAAEQAGANVTGLVADYDEALRLIDTGNENVSNANLIFNDIITESGTLQAAAVQQGNVDIGVAVVKVAVLVGLAVVVWMRGDEWFWRLWRRTKRGYIVE